MERKPDIKQWAEKASNLGLRLGDSLESILKQSVAKKERLKNSGLPIGISYGPFDSFEEIDKSVPIEQRDKTVYFLRCVPKDYKPGKDSKIERFYNVNYNQAKNYFKQISIDSKEYTAELFEIWEPDYSGGLIINNGRVMIDLEKGDRFYSKENEDENKGANLDLTGHETSKTGIHFEYNNNPTNEEKEIMLEALKYINPYLDRELFERLKIYAEYFYSHKEGFKFVDYLEGKEADKYSSFNKKK